MESWLEICHRLFYDIQSLHEKCEKVKQNQSSSLSDTTTEPGNDDEECVSLFINSMKNEKIDIQINVELLYKNWKVAIDAFESYKRSQTTTSHSATTTPTERPHRSLRRRLAVLRMQP